VAKRRGAGEGTIARRSDNRWQAVLNCGYSNGRRVRKYFYGDSEAAVQAQLLKARSDRFAGLPIITEKQTVQQYMEDWLERVLRPRAKPRATESFGTISRRHIFPTLGRIQLAKLTPQHVQRLLDEKSKTITDASGKVKQKGLSAQTITNIRTVLRSALAQALKWGLVHRNVAALVSAPRISRKKITPLDADSARAFLAAARGHRFEAMFLTTLTLGLRRGEVLGLRWQDLDLDARQLRVAQSLQRLKTGSTDMGRKTELRATETKTDGSQRTIALPDSVVAALKSQRARQAEERLVAGPKWQDAGLVFTTPLGRGIEPILLHRAFKAILEKAGLPTTLRLHDLRHSAASLLLAQGVPPRAIMELLGHQSISTTMNLYAHVMPAMMREAADKMDAILSTT
jgi:integrase